MNKAFWTWARWSDCCPPETPEAEPSFPSLMANNETGVLQPVGEVVRLSRALAPGFMSMPFRRLTNSRFHDGFGRGLDVAFGA